MLSAPIPLERRWTSDLGTNTKQDLVIVIVETDDGLTGYGEAKGTPVVMKVLVEDVLGPSLVVGGGVRQRMPAYASDGWAPPEGTADEVLGYRAKGSKTVKIRVGGLDEPHFLLLTSNRRVVQARSHAAATRGGLTIGTGSR